MDRSFQAVRIRREGGARDTINSHAWDFFRATPPLQVASERLERTPVYMDMLPISARTNTVQYREQPQYIPDPPRAATRADGVAPPAGALVPPPTSAAANPYTQRLDVAGSDARNVLRELRNAVVEDNREADTDINRSLLTRMYASDPRLPPHLAAQFGSLRPL